MELTDSWATKTQKSITNRKRLWPYVVQGLHMRSVAQTSRAYLTQKPENCIRLGTVKQDSWDMVKRFVEKKDSML